MNDLMKKDAQTSTVGCKSGSGKTRKMCTAQNEGLVQGQESAPGTQHTEHQL